MPEKTNGNKNTDFDQDLKSEVAALASQLGLAASTGEDAGFDDTDFRPSKKPAGLNNNAKASLQPQRIGRPTPPTAVVKAGQGGISRPRHGAQDTGRDAQKATPGRTWKAGVGPRPGKGPHQSGTVTARGTAVVVCLAKQRGEKWYGGRNRPRVVMPAMLHTGEKQGKSLLGADEPSLWYEAAEALPPVDASAKQSLSHDEVEERRLVAEEAMAGEAASFEKAFGDPLATRLCILHPLSAVPNSPRTYCMMTLTQTAFPSPRQPALKAAGHRCVM